MAQNIVKSLKMSHLYLKITCILQLDAVLLMCQLDQSIAYFKSSVTMLMAFLLILSVTEISHMTEVFCSSM